MKMSKSLPLFVLSTSMSVNAEIYQLIDQKIDYQTDVSEMFTPTSIDINFHVSSLETKDHQKDSPISVDFKELKFKKLHLTMDRGQPMLPVHSVLVKGYPEEIKVEANLGKFKSISGLVPSPAQLKMRCIDCVQPEYTVDWDAYKKEAQEFYKVKYLGMFRGTPITKVEFIPGQYNDKEDALEIYPQAKFKVTSGRFLKGYQNIDEIVAEGRLNNKYIILSPKDYIEDVTPFIEWKKNVGFDVEVFSLEDIGNDFKKIQDFFRAQYKENKFAYALIVGHEKMVVTEYVSTSGSYNTPSDLNYFTMDGGDDYIPDALYGRLVIGGKEDVKNQIQKIIAYEKGQYVDDSGMLNHIGIASNEGYNPSDVEYVKMMLEPFIQNFGVVPSYFFQSNYDSTAANVSASLNKGSLWLNYIGHGDGYAWPSMYRQFKAADIAKLSNVEVKPVVIDVACQNGRFVYGTARLGERFMNSTNTTGEALGAVAYYGGSVNISWHPPAIMAVGINKVVVEKKLEKIGEALLAGHFYLAQNYSTLKDVKDNYRWYHLFGDPSMMIRTTRPYDLAVELVDNKLLIKGTDAPLSQIKVVFNSNGEYQTLITDEAGMVDIPELTGEIKYSILTPGYKYFEGTL